MLTVIRNLAFLAGTLVAFENNYISLHLSFFFPHKIIFELLEKREKKKYAMQFLFQ